MDKVYAFRYCPCIFESGFITVSIHKSIEGAENAMKKHQEELLHIHNEMYKDEEYIEFGSYQSWDIQEVVILP